MPKKENIPEYIKEIKNINWRIRANGVISLGYLGPEASDAVPELIQILKDDHWMVRMYATEALGRMSHSENVAVAVSSMLDDDNSRVRAAAGAALMSIGKNAKPAIPKLLEKINDNDYSVQMAVIGALGEIGSENEVANALIIKLQSIKAIKDEGPLEYGVYKAVIAALQKQGKASIKALPLLKELGEWEAVETIEKAL